MRWVMKKNNPFWKKKLTDESLLKGLLWNRGFKSASQVEEFLNPDPIDKLDIGKTGIDIREIKKAEKRLEQAILKKERILIYGDYDVDGFCSTAILWEGLHFAKINALPYIPDRHKDGYGLNSARVFKIKKKFPDINLVITVDNGIVANKSVSELKSKGIDTIIIDHHLKGKKVPGAVAIIHTTSLSGSGVAWFFIKNLSLPNFSFPDLGLAALGTVADMLPVLGINRSLIKYGIDYLEKTERPGIKSLFRQAGIEGRKIDTQKISFNIAPKLNALGRIANPLDALKLICVRNEKKGEILARHACQINSKRQVLTAKGFLTAQNEFLKQKNRPQIIISSNKSYHRGIVGLIAGKLTNMYGRPAAAISINDGLGHGSARSIKGFNIVKILRQMDNLLIDIGGHSLAAGFTISSDKIALFQKKLTKIADNKLNNKVVQEKIDIDTQLKLNNVTVESYSTVCRMAPFGIGNPEPIFTFKNLRVVEIKSVGKNGDHIRIYLDDPKTESLEKQICESIGFGLGDWLGKIKKDDYITVAAYIDENIWQGRRKIILRLVDLKPLKKMVE